MIRKIFSSSKLTPTKHSLLIGSVLAALVVFHKPIEQLLTVSIVDHVLAYVEEAWYNDVIFLLLCLCILIYSARKWKVYTPSQELILFYILSAVVYLYYRVESDTWVFISSALTDYLKYADVIVLLALCNSLLLLVRRKSKVSSGGSNGFAADEPLISKHQDVFGYTPYVDALATKIRASHLKGAFAIGVNGKWGLGKTSFMELLKSDMSNDSIIQIAFDPWNSSNPKAIIQDFFETLQEGIEPYHASLSRLLISYSNKLVAMHDNTVSQSILASVKAVTGLESLNHLFSNINKALARIDKKIIVYIDDLDRLDKDEIMEVIRLIRNTASFHNTFFIVGYDRNYVISALREQNSYNPEQFLEKIFQLEVTLPHYSKDILRQKLAEKIKLGVPEAYHEDCDKNIIGSLASIPIYLHDWLDSMRHVTRLANAFTLNFSKLAGEVDFNDFLKLELLRMNYPSIYVLLFRQADKFLDVTDQASKNPYYQLCFNRNQQVGKEELEYEILSYLRENHEKLSVPIADIRKVVNFLRDIFPDAKSRGFYQYTSLSITNPLKFDRYFAYGLLQGNLSEIAFRSACTLEQAQFNSKLTVWVHLKAEKELLRRFREIETYQSKEEYEKIIRAIFYLARQPSQFPTQYFGLVGYDGKDLKRKLSDYDSQLSEALYGGDTEGKEKLHTFVKELLESAPSPFTYEADFIHFLYDEYTYAFPLTKVELKDLLLSYLKTYCKQISYFDNHVWYLYTRCMLIEWEPEDSDVRSKVERIPEEANDILKDFILNKDFDGFLRHSIQFYVNGSRFALGVYPSRIFGSREKFKEVLQAQEENRWMYLKEFKEFLAAFEAQGGSNFIEYNFSVIPIDTRT